MRREAIGEAIIERLDDRVITFVLKADVDMEYSITIASVPDREKLVAEIWLGDKMIAEISQDGAEPIVEFYCSDRRLRVSYQLISEALTEALRGLRCD